MPVRLSRALVFALLLVFLLICCLLGQTHRACAATFFTGQPESIESFNSYVTVNADGSMRVREEITVNSAGEDIKTGIIRSFPLKYSGPEKEYTGAVPFRLLFTSIDGKGLKRTADTRTRQGNIDIYIRDGDKKLSPGRHVIALEYETSLHLRFFEDHGELNWNATGADWPWRMNGAFCRITLPEGVPVRKTIGWVGRPGDKNRDSMRIRTPAPNVAEFTSTRSMSPGEQMTVAVAFPRGMIEDPMPAALAKHKRERAEAEARWAAERVEREAEEARQAAEERAAREAAPVRYMLMDMLAMLRPWLGAFLALMYFGPLWLLRGRDPAKGAIIPRFYPPVADYMGKGSRPADFHPAPMSPAAVEYLVHNLNETPRGFASLCLSLAVRKLVGITRDAKGIFVLTPRENPALDLNDVSPEELDAHAGLLQKVGPGGPVRLTPRQSIVRSMRHAVSNRLETDYSEAWSRNKGVVILGWALVLPLCCFASFLPFGPAYGTGDIQMGLILFPLLVYFIGFLFYTVSSRMWALSLFPIIFGGALAAALHGESLLDFSSLFPFLAMIAVSGLFSGNMKAPTKEARRLMDEIEGLHMYMETAEKDRLQMLNRPEDSPEVFERLLPYALALNLEKTWCNRFAGQIAAGLMAESGLAAFEPHDAEALSSFAREFSRAVESSSEREASGGGSAFSSDGGGAGSGSGGGGGSGI